MKKEFKLVSASVIGLVCASLMTPSFAATVRTLGGTGTYTGTSSATQASSTAKSAVTAARAGSVRIGSGTRTTGTSASRASSTRSATAPRLSIGKYLSANSSLGTNNKITVENSSDIKENTQQIQNLDTTVNEINLNLKELQKDVNVLTNSQVKLEYDPTDGMLKVIHGDHESEVSIFDEDAINDLIASKIPDLKEYEAGEMIDITNNKVSAKIVGALTGALDQEEGLVTATQVVDYAIPKPGAGQCDTPSSTCVLSVKNNGELYWLELVDAEPAADGE